MCLCGKRLFIIQTRFRQDWTRADIHRERDRVFVIYPPLPPLLYISWSVDNIPYHIGRGGVCPNNLVGNLLLIWVEEVLPFPQSDHGCFCCGTSKGGTKSFEVVKFRHHPILAWSSDLNFGDGWLTRRRWQSLKCERGILWGWGDGNSNRVSGGDRGGGQNL